MKQLFLSGRGEISVCDVPLPGVLPQSLLVRNAYSLISTGTESSSVSRRGGWWGALEKAASSPARVQKAWQLAQRQGLVQAARSVQQKLADWTPIGYSCCGEVVETSDGVAGVKPGDWVACMGAGLANHAEYVVMPVNMAAPLPAEVDPRQAAFGAVACIAQQGIRILSLSPGESIVVIGLGLVGSLTVLLARAMGYTVYGIDLSPQRARWCRQQLGVPCWTFEQDLPAAVRQATSGRGADAAIISAATGSSQPVNLAFELCRPRGRVSVVGKVGLDLDRDKMYRKELSLGVSCSYGPGRYDAEYELAGRDYPLGHVRWTQQRNLAYFLQLLAERRVDVGRLISHSYPLADAPQAYARLKQADPTVCGVLFEFGHEGRASLPPPQAHLLHTGHPRQAASAEQISLGVIGCGSFARHVHLPNLRRLADRISIAGIASRSGATAAIAARRFGAPLAVSDYRLLLDDPQLDAVLICTRHASHARLVLAALEAGKHVFVEKPLCLTAAEGAQIEALARRNERVVQVGFNRRFAPQLQHLKAAVGESGPRMLTVRVSVAPSRRDHWSNAEAEGGRFLGEGVHFLDLANWFAGSAPRSVSAQYLGPPSPTNPNLAATIAYPDDALCQLTYTTIGDTGIGKEFYEAFGNGRAVRCDDFRRLRTAGVRRRSGWRERHDKGHFRQLVAFADAVQGRPHGGEAADARAGTIATWMAAGVLQSAREGKEITFVSANLATTREAA